MGDTRIISTAVRLCVACCARTTSIPSQRVCTVDREKSQSFGFRQVDMYGHYFPSQYEYAYCPRCSCYDVIAQVSQPLHSLVTRRLNTTRDGPAAFTVLECTCGCLNNFLLREAATLCHQLSRIPPRHRRCSQHSVTYTCTFLTLPSHQQYPSPGYHPYPSHNLNCLHLASPSASQYRITANVVSPPHLPIHPHAPFVCHPVPTALPSHSCTLYIKVCLPYLCLLPGNEPVRLIVHPLRPHFVVAPPYAFQCMGASFVQPYTPYVTITVPDVLRRF